MVIFNPKPERSYGRPLENEAVRRSQFLKLPSGEVICACPVCAFCAALPAPEKVSDDSVTGIATWEVRFS
jgi:hypothetical protein